MAQHDQDFANQSGAAFRSDTNNALAAIFSNSSGATEPAVKAAYQWWADTTTGLLKIRNAANNGWITAGPVASLGAALIAAAGDLQQGSAIGTLARLAIGAAGTRLHSTGALAEWQGIWFSTGSSTRALDAASGSVDYTGVGFQPKAIILLAANGASQVSIGVDDATTHLCINSTHNITADTWQLSTTISVFANEAAGKSQSAIVTAFDSASSGKFTLAWTRTGVTAAGNLTIGWLVLR